MKYLIEYLNEGSLSHKRASRTSKWRLKNQFPLTPKAMQSNTKRVLRGIDTKGHGFKPEPAPYRKLVAKGHRKLQGNN